MILLHCSAKSLGCALSVSKFCRGVILRSTVLRCNLFVEPAPASEHLEIVQPSTQLGGPPGLIQQYIRDKPSETSRTIAKAHPMLIPVAGDFSYERTPHAVTHAISMSSMRKASSSTLLFQPPSHRVYIIFHDYGYTIERPEGVTFGAIFEELEKKRKQCQKTIDEVVKCRYTIYTRQAFSYAMGQLKGPLREDLRTCQSDLVERYVYVHAEDGVMEDDHDVWMARNHVLWTGW